MAPKQMKPEPVIPFQPKRDYRPAKAGWAHGWHTCRCTHCQSEYIGYRESAVCADCAYKTKPLTQNSPTGTGE